MAKCNWIREGTEDVSAMQEAVQEAIISEADILGMKDIVEDIEAEFAVRELVGGIVPEKEIDKFIKEKYGEHSERYLLATKILGLITANPIIRDMVHEMIFEFMPAGVTKKGEVAKSPTFGKVYRDKKIGRKQKDLKLLLLVKTFFSLILNTFLRILASHKLEVFKITFIKLIIIF